MMTFWRDLEGLKALLRDGQFHDARKRLAAMLHTAAESGGELAEIRLRTLQQVASVYDLETGGVSKTDAGTPTDTSCRRLLVSGIGRSGTTLIYQQLAKLLLLETRDVNFRYEPYLWNIRTGQAKGNAFGNEQLNHYGLHVHAATPLFLEGAHDVHDPFIDDLFGAPLDSTPGRMPAAYLTKVIRGSGRLRAYLARYPDIKIVICLRNPLDTINSSLGMFSFFGEEFHQNDRARFAAELRQRSTEQLALPDAWQAVEWYGAWWRAFTEASLSVAEDHPENVFLFCHEQFQKDNEGVLDALQEFVGVRNLGIRMGLSHSAGPSIKATSLNSHDLEKLAPHAGYYRDVVLDRFLGRKAAADYDARLPKKYASRPFSLPLAGSDLGLRSSIQLRGMMLENQASPFQRVTKGPGSPVKLPELIKQHADPDQIDTMRLPELDPAALRQGKTFGAVLTCHNNSDTIVDAVLSCLTQTLPFDEVLVVDDRSTDDSLARLRVLAERYSSMKILPLESSVGPAAARDMGIRRLSTDFFTQLDGDDQFWPTKNAEEARVIAGDETAVAFSDILLVLPDKSLVQDCSGYGGKDGPQLFDRLLSRQPQIPRDMTLSRARYFAAGGYDLTARLYEDWDFKLRLMAQKGEWRHASGVAGTVYNRIKPGLSGVHAGQHARALIMIFLRALRHGNSKTDDLLEQFDAALRPFAERNITKAARQWLARHIERRDMDGASIADFASSRSVASMSNETLAALFFEDKVPMSRTRAEMKLIA